jgi:polyisoprenyl-phosphate glycosyltransferase
MPQPGRIDKIHPQATLTGSFHMSKLLSVIIPVYNEGENVEFIYNQIDYLSVGDLKSHHFEILFSDNGSDDDSYQRIRDLASRDNRVKGIRLSRNFGFQANILSGLLNASGDAIIQLDADGEDPPGLIARFVEKWEEGYDVVYGVRVKRRESAWLTLSRKLYYRMLHGVSDVNLPVDAGDFRLIDRKVADVICNRFMEHNPYLRGLVSFAGFKQCGVPYEREARKTGRSKFSLSSYIVLALDAITSFSRIPLKLVTMVGVFLSVMSFVGAILYFITWLFGDIPVRGFTTLLLVLLLVSGIQLLSLGILGEYIGRIFDEVKNRPRTIVQDYCGFGSKPREG